MPVYHAAMGKLIKGRGRERAKSTRMAREAAIIEGARKAVLSQPPAELSFNSVDRAAGLRQGTSSLVFGSLEKLIFRLLRGEIISWLDRLESLLKEGPSDISPPELGRRLASTLRGSPLFCRLLAVLPVIVGRHKVEMDQVLDLETWRFEQFERVGTLLESRCTALESGGGLLLLRRASLLAGALEPLINPPTGILLAMGEESLSPLYPDPWEELETLLAAILSGSS